MTVRYCEVCSLPALPGSRLCGDARCDIADERPATSGSPCDGCGLDHFGPVEWIEWDGDRQIIYTRVECRYCGLEKP